MSPLPQDLRNHLQDRIIPPPIHHDYPILNDTQSIIGSISTQYLGPIFPEADSLDVPSRAQFHVILQLNYSIASIIKPYQQSRFY